MIVDFEIKNNKLFLIITKNIYGVGFHLDLCRPVAYRKENFHLCIDVIFVRFWWTNYKINNN